MDEPGRRRRPDRHRHARRDRLRPCDTVGLGAGNLRDVVRDVSGAAGLGPGPPGHAVVRALAAALAGIRRSPRTLAARSTLGRRRRRAGAALRGAAQRGDCRGCRHARGGGARRHRGRTASGSDGSRGGESHPSPPTPTTRPSEAWPTASAARPRCSSAGSPSRRDLSGATVTELASAIGALVAPEGPWPVFARLRAARSLACASSRPPPAQRPAWTPTGSRRWRRSARRWRDSRRFSSGSASPRAGGRCVRGRTVQAIRGRRSRRRLRTSRSYDRHGSSPRSAHPTCCRRGRSLRRRAGGRRRGRPLQRDGPRHGHVSSVAFPDVPTARAPQAIVLAVPPVVDEELSAAVLVDIVAEVRDLARARMVDAASMGPATGSLHLAACPRAVGGRRAGGR